MEELKLFIWTDFMPDYTDGLAFAIAKNETDARNQISDDFNLTISNTGTLTIEQVSSTIDIEWGKLEIRSLSEPVCRWVCGGQ